MLTVQLVIVTVWALFVSIECGGPQFGKCDPSFVQPIPIPIDEMETHMNWPVIYATHFDASQLHETLVVSRLGGHNYKMRNRKQQKDYSEASYTYDMSYDYVKKVFVESYVDEKGIRHQFYKIPLKITNSLAFLAYRCSDFGNQNLYYRFIIAPADVSVPESDIQELLAFDLATFGRSHGILKKLPNIKNRSYA